MRLHVFFIMLSAATVMLAADEPVNLIKNPDFRQKDPKCPGQALYWTNQVRAGKNGYKPVAQFSFVPTLEGKNLAAKILVPAPGQAGKSAALYLQLIKVKPNTKYYISCNRKVKFGWAPIFLDQRDEKKKFVSIVGLTEVEKNGPGQFNLCEKSFKTGPNIHYCQLMLTIQNLGCGEAEFLSPKLIELPSDDE